MDTRHFSPSLGDALTPFELHSEPGAIHAFKMVAEAAIRQAFACDMMGGIARLLKLGAQLTLAASPAAETPSPPR